MDCVDRQPDQDGFRYGFLRTPDVHRGNIVLNFSVRTAALCSMETVNSNSRQWPTKFIQWSIVHLPLVKLWSHRPGREREFSSTLLFDWPAGWWGRFVEFVVDARRLAHFSQQSRSTWRSAGSRKLPGRVEATLIALLASPRRPVARILLRLRPKRSLVRARGFCWRVATARMNSADKLRSFPSVSSRASSRAFHAVCGSGRGRRAGRRAGGRAVYRPAVLREIVRQRRQTRPHRMPADAAAPAYTPLCCDHTYIHVAVGAARGAASIDLLCNGAARRQDTTVSHLADRQYRVATRTHVCR